MSRLLDLLIPSTADGFINLRAFATYKGLTPRNAFVKANAPDRAEQIGGFVAQSVLDGYDVYTGIAERGIADGKKASCTVLRAFFTDIDTIKEGRSFADDILKLAIFKPRPSIVIKSGYGLHCYWLVAQPINLRVEGEIAKTESLLRRLAAAVGGDPVATDVSRVLRVEGTLNYKNGAPKPVEIVWCDPTAVLS